MSALPQHRHNDLLRAALQADRNEERRRAYEWRRFHYWHERAGEIAAGWCASMAKGAA